MCPVVIEAKTTARCALLVFVFHVSVFAHSGGAPNDHTTTFQNCATSCHIGNPTSLNGLSLTGLPSTYAPAGDTAFVILTVPSQPVPPPTESWGFSISGAGFWTPGSGSKSSGSNHLTHSAPSATPSWVFAWAPPSSNIGDIEICAAGLASDSSGTSQGDFTFLTCSTIAAVPEPNALELMGLVVFLGFAGYCLRPFMRSSRIGMKPLLCIGVICVAMTAVVVADIVLPGGRSDAEQLTSQPSEGFSVKEPSAEAMIASVQHSYAPMCGGLLRCNPRDLSDLSRSVDSR